MGKQQILKSTCSNFFKNFLDTIVLGGYKDIKFEPIEAISTEISSF